MIVFTVISTIMQPLKFSEKIAASSVSKKETVSYVCDEMRRLIIGSITVVIIFLNRVIILKEGVLGIFNDIAGVRRNDCVYNYFFLLCLWRKVEDLNLWDTLKRPTD